MADSMSISSSAWLTGVVALFGFAGTLLSPLFASYAAGQRERQARKEARYDVAKQKQIDFQYENLIALQDATERLLRLAEQAQLYGVKNLTEIHVWPVQNYPQKLSLAIATAFITATKLEARVLDETVRRECHELIVAFQAVVHADNYQASRIAMQKLVNDFECLNGITNERLRKLYDEALEI